MSEECSRIWVFLWCHPIKPHVAYSGYQLRICREFVIFSFVVLKNRTSKEYKGIRVEGSKVA